MTDWDRLVACAVIGTGRMQPPDAGIEGYQPESAEAGLLAAAGVLTATRRAAALPAPAIVPDESACPPEGAGRICGSRARLRLQSFLAGDRADVLPEFLRLLSEAGIQSPPELLPALLDAGRQSVELRPHLAKVAGGRGLWLAEQNPRWHYLLGLDEPVDPAVWETGQRGARVAYLRHLRERDPVAGRELLQQSWDQEDAQNRAVFVQALAAGLGPEDEPFLEAALGDRGKTVRREAVDLLAQLPQSAFQERMRARVLPLLRVEQTGGVLGVGRKSRLEVTLPAQCDPAMVRDGIETKRPANLTTLGDRAWWLLQMLGFIHPSEWESALGLPPAELVQLPGDEKALVFRGWCDAAARFRSLAWAEVLIEGMKSMEGAGETLLALLPPDRLEQLAQRSLGDRNGFGGHSPALLMVVACRHAWSPTLTRRVLAVLKERTRGKADWQLLGHIASFALRADPGCLAEATSGWPDSLPYWQEWAPAIRRFQETLQLRRELDEEARG